MDYENIVTPSDKPALLETGKLNKTYSDKAGTTVRLTNFLPKRVPDKESFHRQLAARFVFADPKFNIIVEDTRNPAENPRSRSNQLPFQLMRIRK
jgi:hypothetical protein